MAGWNLLEPGEIHREGVASAILCFDFDGTLVDAEGRIHPADIDILANEKSVSLVPATGRPLHAVRRAFGHHGLFEGRPIPFPLVLENGAAVYSENEMLRSRRCLEPELRKKLLEAVLSTPRASFLLHSLDEVARWETTPCYRRSSAFRPGCATVEPRVRPGGSVGEAPC